MTPALLHPQARFPLQQQIQAADNPKSRGAEGVKGATADIRLFSLPPRLLRRGEIPCLPKRATMVANPAIRSRPFGATICKWSHVQLGGASEDAQSYWQGRFAACTFVVAVSFELVARGTVGALPQSPAGTLSLHPARDRRKGTKSPLDPFWAARLGRFSLPLG